MSTTTIAAVTATAAASTSSNNNITIRPLEQDDVGQVCDLWVNGLQQTRDAVAHLWIIGRILQTLMDRLEAQATSPDGHVGPCGQHLFQFWKEEQKDREMYVAVTNSGVKQEVVGCVGVKRGIQEDTVDMDSPYASVWMVSVRESSRRSGIGAKLMQQAETWALQQEGCTKMHLITGNPVGRAFYLQLGYHNNHWIKPSMEKALFAKGESQGSDDAN